MTLSELTLLGIETSCDETAAAVVQRRVDSDGTVRGTILSNVIRSQFDAHAAYGGVVPEIAARAHVTVLDGIIRQAMAAAGTDWDDLSGIAVTSGPGLIGGLLVGTVTAQAIATARGLPLVGINHLEGHALTATLTDATAFPFLLLLVSGGHTQILLVSGVGRYHRLGSTIDDALGEAFDKVAKMLDLGFPGGPAVEAAALSGEAGRFDLPRPLWKKAGCNFSFSGLKTALRHRAEACAPLTDRDVADLCAGFQAAVCDVVADRTGNAFADLADNLGATDIMADGDARPINALVVAGGVAANQAIRSRLTLLCASHNVPFVAPSAALCTDNGAMIAWAGAQRLATGMVAAAPPDGPALAGPVLARPRWPLDEAAEPLSGSGKRGVRV